MLLDLMVLKNWHGSVLLLLVGMFANALGNINFFLI